MSLKTSTIGSRIRLRREELGMTQDELAIRIGFKNRSTITKIELDARNLTQRKIKAIADALHVTPEYIMGWENETNHAPEISIKDLSEEEKELIKLYRSMDQPGKYFINAVVDREKSRRE